MAIVRAHMHAPKLQPIAGSCEVERSGPEPQQDRERVRARNSQPQPAVCPCCKAMRHWINQLHTAPAVQPSEPRPRRTADAGAYLASCKGTIYVWRMVLSEENKGATGQGTDTVQQMNDTAEVKYTSAATGERYTRSTVAQVFSHKGTLPGALDVR